MGETLAERLAKGPVPIGDALPMAAQIADTLAAAHDRGIVHRDVKPANIKITPAQRRATGLGIDAERAPDSLSAGRGWNRHS